MNLGHSSRESVLESLCNTDCGLPEVYLKGIVTNRCTNKDCGEEEISIPNIEDLHQLLVEKIATSTISKHFFKFDRDPFVTNFDFPK